MAQWVKFLLKQQISAVMPLLCCGAIAMTGRQVGMAHALVASYSQALTCMSKVLATW